MIYGHFSLQAEEKQIHEVRALLMPPLLLNIIRIYHECEGRIEKSVPKTAVWHHEACRVMTNGDTEGQIFLSYPRTKNGFFFLPTTVFFFLF